LLTYPEFRALVSTNRFVHGLIRDNARGVYCVLFRDEQSAPIGDIQAELQYWMTDGIFEYVSAYDQAVEWTFNPTNTIPPLPSIVESNGRALVPPHPFSEFLNTAGGLAMLIGQIPHVLALAQSADVFDRRAALYCLGHFASDARAAAYVEEYKLLEVMVASANSIESYVVRGTFLSALSLVAVTPKIAERLSALGLTVGANSCIVPVDINSMVIPVSSRLFVAPEILTPPSEAAKRVTDLINPLTVAQAKNELGSLSINDLASYDNSVFIHRFLMSYNLDYATVQFVIALFGRIPLVPGDETPVDLRIEAEAYARLYEAHLLGQHEQALAKYTFSTLPIPVMAMAEVSRARPGALAPEVYLTDLEFQAITGVDKNTFYTRCTDEQRIEVRNFIMRT
jgi:hypothetical protein